MIKTFDGKTFARRGGLQGDRAPLVGLTRSRALYTATGGETSINLQSLTPQISYFPGNAQISIKRSSGGSAISGVHFFETSANTIGFPSNGPLIQGELVEITLEVGVTGVMAAQPRPDVYTAVGVAGQTLVSCPFSWTYNMNQAYGIGAVRVYLHGILQTRGSDYTEVSLGTPNTNQIQFVDPLVGGENIVVLPSYQVLDQSAAASTFVGQQMSGVQSEIGAGFQAFVDQTASISVPATTVVGRAKIPDITQDLRTSLGIERISVQQIYQLQNEFGPNGEPVWSALNDDRGMVRFVGGWASVANSFGPFVQGGLVNDFVEITFYGTGISLLTDVEGVSPTNLDYRATVDGGAESANIFGSATYSPVLGQRNYPTNQIVSVFSGLSLGIHTVKIRRNNSSGNYFNFYGYEVINSSATGTININPGSAYISGQKYAALTSQSLLYSASVTGTRGGRVLTYLKADGTIGQAFQAVDATALYLASTSHINEEMVRQYSPREFGAGRADDFSYYLSASTANLAFTLDDGTTTLVGNQVAMQSATNAEDALWISGSAGVAAVTITFVGTGLDIVRSDNTTGTDTHNVFVDGANVGNLNTTGSTTLRHEKICSGLPYGTHTVKILRATASAYGLRIHRFKVYQPKKPALPAGTVELADYNVVANFVANTTVTIDNISSGVLKKACTREMIYTGASALVLSVGNSSSGWIVQTATATDYYQYTFFGTGVDLRIRNQSTGVNQTFSIDGSTNLSGFTTSFLSVATGMTFTASTGVLSGTPSSSTASILSISGLPLGLHTVKMVQNTAGANTMQLDSIDVITPIHSVKSNLFADLQNTLTVGSQGISDNRQITPIKGVVSAQKAWTQAVGVTSSPTTTSATLVPLPDMSCTVKTNGGRLKLSFSGVFYESATSSTMAVQFFVDGLAVGVPQQWTFMTAGVFYTLANILQVPVSPGTHKVDAYWSTNAGTVTANGANRILIVEEA